MVIILLGCRLFVGSFLQSYSVVSIIVLVEAPRVDHGQLNCQVVSELRTGNDRSKFASSVRQEFQGVLDLYYSKS